MNADTVGAVVSPVTTVGTTTGTTTKGDSSASTANFSIATAATAVSVDVIVTIPSEICVAKDFERRKAAFDSEEFKSSTVSITEFTATTPSCAILLDSIISLTSNDISAANFLALPEKTSAIVSGEDKLTVSIPSFVFWRRTSDIASKAKLWAASDELPALFPTEDNDCTSVEMW